MKVVFERRHAPVYCCQLRHAGCSRALLNVSVRVCATSSKKRVHVAQNERQAYVMSARVLRESATMRR